MVSQISLCIFYLTLNSVTFRQAVNLGWALPFSYINIYINIMRGKKDVTTFPDKPVS